MLKSPTNGVSKKQAPVAFRTSLGPLGAFFRGPFRAKGDKGAWKAFAFCCPLALALLSSPSSPQGNNKKPRWKSKAEKSK